MPERLSAEREAEIRRARAECSEIVPQRGRRSAHYKPVTLRLADFDAVLAELAVVRADLAAAVNVAEAAQPFEHATDWVADEFWADEADDEWESLDNVQMGDIRRFRAALAAFRLVVSAPDEGNTK